MICFENVSVAYGDHRVFRGLSFAVEPGERIALTGPSGAGKSTVLGCLLGWVQPEQGRILVGNIELTVSSIWELRRRMAFVPQEADLGRGSVNEFLERPFQYAANREKCGNLSRVPVLMEALGLASKLRDTAVELLSGGEKQRVALLAALLLDRPILMLDEVTSALDEESAQRVAALLEAQREVTMLGVVHEGRRMPYATRVVEVRHDT